MVKLYEKIVYLFVFLLSISLPIFDNNRQLLLKKEGLNETDRVSKNYLNRCSLSPNELDEEYIDLESENIDVILELNKMIDYYSDLYLDTFESDVEQKNKINNMIETLQLMIKEYEIAEDSYSLEDEIQNSKLIGPIQILQLNEMTNPAACIYAISFFSNHGYKLSAELLTHMRANKDYDSVYKPINSDVFKESEKLKQLVYNKNNTGFGDFENHDSSVAETDMYYAVNKFNYSKSQNNDVIVLTDRYDFDFGTEYKDFKTQTGVNLMYKAQQEGYLTPFYTVIEVECDYNVYNKNEVKEFPIKYWRYNECQATLSKGEILEYSIIFSTSGYRNIQTFGYNDSYLLLKNGDGTILTQDNDNGYEKNALISWYFIENVNYRLFVKMNDSNDIGNIRIGVTSSNCSSYDSITQIEKKKKFFIYKFYDIEVNNDAGIVSLYTLKPTKKYSFSIETISEKKHDNYLLFIDPRRADVSYDEDFDKCSSADSFNSCIGDRNSGGNKQAKIELVKQNPNVPFLIIACSYQIFVPSSFKIKISGLN